MLGDSEGAVAPGFPVLQYTILLPNRVGALAQVVNVLADAHVEVIGLSVSDSVDATTVRMVVSDPAVLEALFAGNGVSFSDCELTVVELTKGAAGLGECLSCLLEAEVNLHFSYPLMSRPAGHALLAMYFDDADFGRSVLMKSGYKLLYQDDLSR